MKWEGWRPWHERIVKKLDLDPTRDESAARVLNDLLPNEGDGQLRKIIEDREVIVFGAGPSLEGDILRLKQAGWLDKVLISADGATTPILEHRPPDIIVTDLDGNVEDQVEAWRQGSWLVIHAHGDNIDSVRRVLPELDERVAGTTQTKAFDKLFNFGGFTDGDRAAFMAHEFGSSTIFLAGMNLGGKIGRYSGRVDKKRKMIKLDICKQLLGWLGRELGADLVNLTKGGDDIPNVPRLRID